MGLMPGSGRKPSKVSKAFKARSRAMSVVRVEPSPFSMAVTVRRDNPLRIAICS